MARLLGGWVAGKPRKPSNHKPSYPATQLPSYLNRHLPRAVADLVDRHLHRLEHRHEEIGHWRLRRVDDVASTLQAARGSAGQDDREVSVIVLIAVADAAPVQHQ